jgi:hypothetical protein
MPHDWLWLPRGITNPEIFGCGHSHRYAMLEAIGNGLVPPVVRLAVLSQSVPFHIEADDKYWDKVANARDTGPLAVVWGGNVHNRFILRPAQGFTVVHGDLVASAGLCDPVVPIEAVRALFLPYLSGLESLLKLVTNRRKVFVLGSPPPKSEAFVRRGIAKETGYVEIAKQRGIDVATAPISSLSLRKALWNIYQQLFSEIASRHTAVFVPVPSAAMADDGSLREDLCALDATHGNAAYGALMWREVLAAIGR